MRILYDHQLFSLQDAGGASRYYYELIRSFAGASEVRAELWLGIGATTYPFRQLSEAQAHVVSCGGFLKRGRPRYIVNEVLSNVRAPFAGRLEHLSSHPVSQHTAGPGAADRGHPPRLHRRTLSPPLSERESKHPLQAPPVCRGGRDHLCVGVQPRDLLQFYGVDRAKTRVIHHGLARLQGSEAAAAELRGQAPGEYLLFVGRRAAYKNFNGLLRAFRATGLHKSMLLLAAGGGPLTSEERALAEELGVASSLVVLPQMADTLLAEAYAGATLFVYPSWCEGFGFPPLEAMAAGCPALVSNTSSLPEICQDAPFYFNPQNEGSFERALLEAMNDDKARQRARERGNSSPRRDTAGRSAEPRRWRCTGNASRFSRPAQFPARQRIAGPILMKNLKQLLYSDLARQYELEGKPDARPNLPGLLRRLLHPRFLPIVLCRLSRASMLVRIPVLPELLTYLNIVLFGLEVTPRCKIGPGIFFPHPSGTVIGAWRIGATQPFSRASRWAPRAWI